MLPTLEAEAAHCLSWSARYKLHEQKSNQIHELNSFSFTLKCDTSQTFQQVQLWSCIVYGNVKK